MSVIISKDKINVLIKDLENEENNLEGIISSLNTYINELEYQQGKTIQHAIQSLKTSLKNLKAEKGQKWESLKKSYNEFEKAPELNKTAKDIKNINNKVNGTGYDAFKGSWENKTLFNPKEFTKMASKSIGIAGFVSAGFDGVSTYLERKDKYGEAAAITDGTVHGIDSVASSVSGAVVGGFVGSLIPLPVVGTMVGSFVGGWLGNLVSGFLNNSYDNSVNRH